MLDALAADGKKKEAVEAFVTKLDQDCIEHCERGGIFVLIFPSVTRSEENIAFKRGAATIALHARNRLVPAFFQGPKQMQIAHLLHRPLIQVTFGSPIPTAELPFGKGTTIDLTRQLQAAIDELRSIADFSDLPPSLMLSPVGGMAWHELASLGRLINRDPGDVHLAAFAMEKNGASSHKSMSSAHLILAASLICPDMIFGRNRVSYLALSAPNRCGGRIPFPAYRHSVVAAQAVAAERDNNTHLRL